jgi:hypothetical protein
MSRRSCFGIGKMKDWIGCLALAAASASANTQVVKIEPTNTQALIHIQTDQPGSCTYRISESESLSPPVNDVNELLFPGSTADARPGATRSKARGARAAGRQEAEIEDRWFVAGTRTAARASDGRWYSRALAAATIHYGGVTCGADAEVPFRFQTIDIPYGDTYTEPLPFDGQALGNYALPTVDFSDLTRMYIDPQTGFKFRFITGPGQLPSTTEILTGSLATMVNAGNVEGAASGTNWTNPRNGLVTDRAMASYTAAAQDILVLRWAGLCGVGKECHGWNWQSKLGNGGGFSSLNIDAYQLALTGNGGGARTQVDVALSWNGVDQGTEWKTLTLDAASSSKTYPADLSAGLAAWQGPNYPTIPGMIWHTIQQKYAVNTAGAVVTLTNPPANYGGANFSLDARILKAGSKITIGSAEYTIASVDSGTQVTLTDNAGQQSNVTAYTANFSVLIRKHANASGTVNIDGATVKLAYSYSFGNGGSGFQQFCSPLTSADSKGQTGRFCIFGSSSGTPYGIYWLTDDLEVRYLGRAFMPASALGVTADEYSQALYSGQSIFDSSDANSWWISTTLVSNGKPTLVKATYNPGGVKGCKFGADYKSVAPDSTYASASTDNCNITYVELTRPSRGLDIAAQFNAKMTSGKFTTPSLSFIQDGAAIMTATAGSQDSESWLVTVDLATGRLRGLFSTYMNSAKASCRACVLHGAGPSSALDHYYYLVFNSYPGGTGTGQGPYHLTVSTALTNKPAGSCAGVTDPAVAWMINYAAGCDNITLTAADNIPCDPNPSSWELANAPACSWHAGWTQWQAGSVQIGDWMLDPGVPQSLNDRMVIGAHVSGSTWTVLRGVGFPQGPAMTVPPGTYFPVPHTAGWTAALFCTYQNNAFVSTAETTGAGMLWDRKFYSFNHAVMRPAGILSSEYYSDLNDFGFSVRLGALPEAVNKAESARVRNTAPFSGKTGVGGFNFVQSHIGWDGNLSSFTDMAPLGASSGGTFSLWPQTGVTRVSGSLYRIPAAKAFIAHDKRRRATAVWSGMYNFQDISGLGTITGVASDRYKYCSIDYAGATCGQSEESPGDVFMNIPQATIDGNSGGAFDVNRPNAVPLGQEPMAVLQYDFSHMAAQAKQYLGQWERRLTTGFARYNGQDTYSNAKVIPNSKLLVFNCAAPNLQRIQDLCVAKIPADPAVSTDKPGNDFLLLNFLVEGNAQYAEIQFGYAENGPADQFFCTTRQEACNTSSAPGTPFNWEGEPRTLTPCSEGCIIKVPALPDRIVYYSVRWSDDGAHWRNSALGAAAAVRMADGS